MSENKKYYWLKLKSDFFNQKEIKKLRTIAGGDTFTIIYLKLQLLSLTNEGRIYFDGVEDTFAEEMALTIDEDTENVKLTLLFLQKHGLIEQGEQDEYFLPGAAECMGKITQEGIRKSKYRQKLGQCPERVPLLSKSVPPEIEIEIEKEKEIDSRKRDLLDIEVEVDPIYYNLAETLAGLIELNDPKAFKGKNRKQRVNSWAQDIRKLVEIDEREPGDVETVIRWCQADIFWRSNILSGAKLRKQFTTLLLQMNRPKAESWEEKNEREYDARLTEALKNVH